MRTQEEIAQRMRDSASMFGFEREIFVGFLDLKHAKEFLKDEAVAEYESGSKKWDYKDPTRENVLAEMKEYMAFGWEKVDDHRGLSANRTIEKMQAWAWVLGDDELMKKIEDAPYPQYGAPKLKAICDHLDWSMPDSESIRNMANGEHCGADYGCGCGM